MRKERIRELAENIHVMGTFDAKQYLDPEPPVVTINIPVKHDEREERRDEWDRITFKNIAKDVKEELIKDYGEDRSRGIIEKMDYILDHEDLPLWIDGSEALCFLISNDDCYVFNLNYAHKPTKVVGGNYRLKPLIHDEQYNMAYKLLLLNTDFFAILDGDYNAVHYVALPKDVKDFFAETYPEFDGETTALDYYSLEDHESPYHDHKSRKEVTKEEAEKFFRYVNKAMNDTLVRDSDIPVILVTDPEHEAMFRKIASFQHLLPEGIRKDPRDMTGTELRDAARKIMAGTKDAKIEELDEKFTLDLSKGKASDDLSGIASALFDKKVDTLLIASGKGITGKSYDPSTGKVEDVDGYGNLTDEFIKAAIEQDSNVLVLDAGKMPTDKPMGAIFRY